jgi:transposase-like protein
MEQGRANGRRKANRKRAISCPYCSSERTVLRGLRKNLKSDKQLFLCRSCGRKFTQDDGYLRMRFPRETIKEAVSLYGKGFSSAEVRKNLERKGVRVSRWTVIRWAKRFGR